MTTALSPLPIQHFVNSNGNALSGGQLFTYLAGTTTKAATYTDSTGNTANTNPVILNSRGEANVWLTPGTNLKFVLAPSTDTDPPTNPIWTVDNIAPADGISAAMLPVVEASTTAAALALMNYQQSWSNTVARSVVARLGDIVSVKDFGATGNGTTDDTTAIQNAITYLLTVGGTLYFPQGNYLISGSGLTVNTSSFTGTDLQRVSILGAGKGNTQLTYTGTGTCLSYIGGATSDAINGFFTIEKLAIKGPGTSALNGLKITLAAYFACRDLFISNFTNGCTGLDILISKFESCMFSGNSQGFTADYNSFSSPNAITFDQCTFAGNTIYGVNLGDPTTCTFIGCDIEGNGLGGVGTCFGCAISNTNSAGGDDGACAALFLGCYFESNATVADIYFLTGENAGPSGITVIGCTFNRLSGTAGKFVTNNILMAINTAYFGALTVIGCGFRGFGTYTPSSGTPYIAVSASAFDWTYTAFGNVYASATEIPVIPAPTATPPAMATAWCFFDGATTGTNAPTQGFNVSTVQRTGTGTYVVTFANGLSSTNYAVTGSVNGAGAVTVYSEADGAVTITTMNFSGTATDFSGVSVMVFGSGPA